jgi:hypothetical protein
MMDSNEKLQKAEEQLTSLRQRAAELANELPWAADVLLRSATQQPSGEDCLDSRHPPQQLPFVQHGHEPHYQEVIDLLYDLRRVRMAVYNAEQSNSVSPPRTTVNTLD